MKSNNISNKISIGYYLAAIILRIVLLIYGIWQDSYTPLKYTDIDYFVFTDAARFVAQGQSPYMRETYRYTPLLAWILWPTTLFSSSKFHLWLFSLGKIIFASGDIIAGYLTVQILKNSLKISNTRALGYASIWLLNPMVATISTRGSSEGLLGALVITLLWAVLQRKVILAGFLLGLAVHLKIYPFIYGPSIIWWLDDRNITTTTITTTTTAPTTVEKNNVTTETHYKKKRSFIDQRVIWNFFNSSRLTLVGVSLLTFASLNILMYSIYGQPFLQHTYLYHVIRLDHRHNFSPFNTYLYFLSSTTSTSSSSSVTPNVYLVKLAFLPQLFLSAFAIPFLLAKKDLPSTMLAQTYAFVSFNKVCTSQYFIWYIVFIPFYLPKSSLLSRKYLGSLVVILWIVTQAIWLHQAYQLEFLGRSTFIPGLWLSSILFFFVNSWILGIIIKDIGLGLKKKSLKV
ncbi:GPI mannosyltransferase [Erysiphe necator]|uniref:GPI mannosyltransferase 1 n=1 Tax=Uncinula necator TaxID=52586 RepID=A0A0B1PGN5_UNCNE|nr:GPI mannosyltransferase [Erysiphe necator]KHJ36021.1 putative glycosyltransferase family 50 protein [Erysiphe necator]